MRGCEDLENPSKDTVKKILSKAKTIAVVGLSHDPLRTSYQVSEAMQQAGYRIIPVNPRVKEVLGEKAYASLTDIEVPVDIINIFRRSEFLPEIAQRSSSNKMSDILGSTRCIERICL